MDDLRERIIYLKDVKRFSFIQIGKELGLYRKRVARIYNGEVPRRNTGSHLDKYRSLICQWFHDHPHLNADQVYRWLQDRGVKISYPSVALYTREFRKKKKKAYHNLTFLPGEEGQVDWAIINYPKLGKIYCFTFILSYSRYLFAHLFPRSSFEFFIQGHLMAFEKMNGLPHSLRYDNLKSVVLQIRPYLKYNPRFLDFCRHYGINIRLCNPAAGNEKGRVERAIRTIKHSFFNINHNISSLANLNKSLHLWIDEKNNTIHRATQKKPIELFHLEKLKPLPSIHFNNINILPPKITTKTAMIIFDTNTYSVPDYLVGRALTIYAYTEKIDVYDQNKKVASHPRSFDRYKQIINPIHRSYQRLSNKAKAQRIYEVINNMHPVIAKFLAANQNLGEDNYKTAYHIFKLLKHNSRGIIISAISECLKTKSPRLKTLLTYFNIQSSNNNSETVQTNNKDLLHITYNPRSLDDYDE